MLSTDTLLLSSCPISGVGSFKDYLYKTARNLIMRHKQKRRALGTACMAACLLLVIGIDMLMPTLMVGVTVLLYRRAAEGNARTERTAPMNFEVIDNIFQVAARWIW